MVGTTNCYNTMMAAGALLIANLVCRQQHVLKSYTP